MEACSSCSSSRLTSYIMNHEFVCPVPHVQLSQLSGVWAYECPDHSKDTDLKALQHLTDLVLSNLFSAVFWLNFWATPLCNNIMK